MGEGGWGPLGGVDIRLDRTVRCKADGCSVWLQQDVRQDAAGLVVIQVVTGHGVDVRVGVGCGCRGGIPMCGADAVARRGSGLRLVRVMLLPAAACILTRGWWGGCARQLRSEIFQETVSNSRRQRKENFLNNHFILKIQNVVLHNQTSQQSRHHDAKGDAQALRISPHSDSHCSQLADQVECVP